MYKTQQDRHQLQMICLESMVGKDSLVRVIDAFVDTLNIEQEGFIIKGKINNGAPAYRSCDLLKLYYYGYLNRVRSSRRLERETQTNLEAIWLIRGAEPSYKTIANFRKDNPKALKQVFKQFNQFLFHQNLFDTATSAVDGSKFRAQNSKKNNYNEKKVQQHLDYIEKQTQAYLRQMDEVDQVEQNTEIELEQSLQIAQKLDHLQQRKAKYEQLQEQLQEVKQEGQTQISTTDPDARALPKKMNIVEVSYNVVISADAKNKLITNFEVFNEADTYTLSQMALETRKVLHKQEEETLDVLADKGFDTGHELMICAQNKIKTIVAPRKRLSNKKNKAFAKPAFFYDDELDQYLCPQGEQLCTNGTWYNKKAYSKHRASYKFQRYTCSFNICKHCPFKLDCVGQPNLDNSKGKFIERSQYEPYIEENKERYQFNKERYRQRQAIIEHPFGTIKRQWGFDYTLLKTLPKVEAEFSIIFTCYNLRRAMSLLGVKELIKRLKEAKSSFFDLKQAVLSISKCLFYHRNKLAKFVPPFL